MEKQRLQLVERVEKETPRDDSQQELYHIPITLLPNSPQEPIMLDDLEDMKKRYQCPGRIRIVE